jgi:hypothetical protein
MIEFPQTLAEYAGFEWDAGNTTKNWKLHKVTQGEIEQAFFNRPILIAADEKHSQREARHAALGQTSSGRLLALVFTVRGTLIRIISARDMSRRERRIYEREEKGS